MYSLLRAVTIKIFRWAHFVSANAAARKYSPLYIGPGQHSTRDNQRRVNNILSTHRTAETSKINARTLPGASKITLPGFAYGTMVVGHGRAAHGMHRLFHPFRGASGSPCQLKRGGWARQACKPCAAAAWQPPEAIAAAANMPTRRPVFHENGHAGQPSSAEFAECCCHRRFMLSAVSPAWPRSPQGAALSRGR